MTLHPREPRGLDRRQFLQRSAAAAVAASGSGWLLAACGSDGDGGAAPETGGSGGAPVGEAPFPIARRDNPVTMPLYDDNPAIAGGLEPEAGPLKIYNWIDYIDKKTVKKFAEEYGVETEITIFNTMDEAIAKLRTGGTDFDVFFPTVDRLGKLVAGKLLQPLNYDYIPNLTNVWPQLQNPFYDQGPLYTVPYTVYTTGIGYRTDKVADPASLGNPYDLFFDEAYSGRTFLLDDYREAMGMLLLRNGVTDVNTSDQAALDQVRQQLLELTDAVNLKVSVLDYTLVPEGRAWVHQAWSGDFVSAQYYLPKGVEYGVLGYWYPADGRGMVGSDTMAVLRSAKNPVLAHEFVNFMLDNDNGYANFYNFTGYQPPLNSLNPDLLVSDEVVPDHLASTVVRPEDFDEGYTLLELTPEVDAAWQNIWAEFKSGV